MNKLISLTIMGLLVVSMFAIALAESNANEGNGSNDGGRNMQETNELIGGTENLSNDKVRGTLIGDGTGKDKVKKIKERIKANIQSRNLTRQRILTGNFIGQGFIENEDDKLAFPINIHAREFVVLQFKKEVAKLGIASEEEAEEKVKNELGISGDITKYWVGKLVVKSKGARVFKLLGIEKDGEIKFLVIPLKKRFMKKVESENIEVTSEDEVDENAVDELETETGKFSIRYPKIGKLTVNVKRYPRTEIWEGEGSFGREWRLVSYGEHLRFVKRVVAKLKEQVKIGNFTIQPVSIRRKRFLGIIPLKKKIATYRILKEGRVEEIKAEIGKRLRIGDVEISTKESGEGVEIEIED